MKKMIKKLMVMLVAVFLFMGIMAPVQADGEDDLPRPETNKQVIPNGDGTYKIRLDVTGKITEDIKKTGANVLIVLDRTTSMGYRMNQTSGSYVEGWNTNGTTVSGYYNNNNLDADPSTWSRMQVARSAVNALVQTLSGGEGPEKDIDYALATFYRRADSLYQWGTPSSVWTKDAATFNGYIQNSTSSGLRIIEDISSNYWTNWEAGLEVAIDALETRTDNDNTYVLFVTDGDPNWYNGRTGNSQDTSGTALTRAQAVARRLAAMSNVKLYGIFCGASSGYANLETLIKDPQVGGTDANLINGNNPTALVNAFANIAQTIVDELGANNVSVDDGVPSLASVSAKTVDGVATGFEYFRSGGKNEDGSEKYDHTANDGYGVRWAEAPAAAYDNNNGVIWNLGSMTLEAGVTYTVTFDVWPSQPAYDKIADLNNGLITMTEEELAAEHIAYEEGVGYYLLTNTHLNTTYTIKNTQYTDRKTQWPNEHMKLPTTTISFKKVWNNELDARAASDVRLTVTKDGQPYLYDEGEDDDPDKIRNAIPMSEAVQTGPNQWTQTNGEEIYISMGQMKKFGTDNNTGTIEVISSGHEYTVTEPESFSYNWELTSDIYHPMVINGTATVLTEIDKAKLPADVDQTDNTWTLGSDGKEYYMFAGNAYVAQSGENVLTATNDRRSNLNLTKTVEGTGDPEDALFTYDAKLTYPDGIDDDIWFSIIDADGSYIQNGDFDVTDYTNAALEDIRIMNDGDDDSYENIQYHEADDTHHYNYYTYTRYGEAQHARAADDGTGNAIYTGFYHTADAQNFTLKIRKGWNVRFTNLPNNTQYEFTETDMPEGFIFKTAVCTADNGGTPGTLTEQKLSGSIDKPNNMYIVTFTNTWLGSFYVYHSSNNKVERIYLTDERVTRVKNEDTGAFTFTFNIIDEVLTEDEETGIKYLYGGYYSDYAGKSSGYDSTAVTDWDENNWYTDNGTGVKPYTYVNIVRDNSGWTYADGYDVNGFNAVVEQNETYYLKEVPTGYLTPYTHFTYRKPSYDIVDNWAMSVIDDANYQQSGFVIIDKNKKANVCKSLSLVNQVGGASVKLEPQKVFAKMQVKSGYLTYLKLSAAGIDPTNKTILQYWVTKDNIRVTGTTSRTITQLTNKKTGLAYTDNTAAANSTCVEFEGNN